MPYNALAFGVFELDPDAGELCKRGVRLRLQAKPLAVLTLLLEHAGELVTHEQLRQKLWPSDTFVDFEHGLGVAVSKLRNALGDTAESPRYIETLPRRGYRFIAPVRDLGARAVPSGKTMMAVLPFDDLGSGEEYFADGLTEEMITQLGRVNPQRLGVIARTSAMRYKGTGKPISQIGRELGVRYLMTGGIRRSADRVRITAQLIQAADETQLWAEAYERPITDIVALQTDVAEKIAKSLAVELIPGHQDLIARPRTMKPEAYELYLQGRYHWNKRTDESAFTAIQYFERAVAADPDYALAHAGLADAHIVLGLYGVRPPAEAYGKAKTHARRALEFDCGLAEAHSSLAFALLQFDWDWTASEHEHLRAIELSPNCAPAHHWYGLDLTQVGRFPEARRALQRALDLDPFSVAIQAHLGRLSYFARDYDRSLEELRRAVALDPSYGPARYFLSMCKMQLPGIEDAISELQKLMADFGDHPVLLSALAHGYGKLGKLPEAQRSVQKLKEISRRTRFAPFFAALAVAWPGNSEEVINALENCYAERCGWLLYLRIEPALDWLRSDARFRDLVNRTDVFRQASAST